MSPTSSPPSRPVRSQPERVHIQVDEPFAALVDAEDLARAIESVLASEGRPAGEVTLVLADDEQVQSLNRRYLGEDRPTDVLSFPAAGPPAGGGPSAFVSAPEAAGYLGDIIIAFPFARRQAEEAGHALGAELRLLAVHGTLHLLGYDHADPQEEAAMWARQDAILAQLAL